ncbi:sugar transferase [Candidatus Gracilibacteria bacterium]|nr:sugar transferase [Candidatus Gracilibacteria bacterium]
MTLPRRALTPRDTAWRRIRLCLVVGDLLALAVAFTLAYALRFWTGWDFFQEGAMRPGFYAGVTLVFVPFWIGLFALYGLYNPRRLFHGSQEYALVFNASLLGVVMVVVFSFLIPSFVIARAWLLLAWLLTVASVTSWRFIARRYVYSLRHKGRLMERTVIIGANAEGRAVAEHLSSWAGSGAQIVGFIDEQLPIGSEVLGGMPVIGPASAIQSIIEQHHIDVAIVADTAIVRERLPMIVGAMESLQQLDVRLAPGLFELLTTGVRVQEQGGVNLLALNKTRITGLHAFTKMLLDRGGALIGLVALAPLFVLIAIAVYLDSGGPVIYRRRVVGVGKIPFDAFKFRTMHRNGDALLTDAQRQELRETGKLKVDPRITRVGRYLRKASIDELPQLLNVLFGQMSLVGPRMLTVEELSHFGRWQHNLLTVRPGLTGLWQISGRSDLGYEDRVRLDMHYIRNYSIWLDLSIILRTVPSLLSGKGAY